MRSVSPSTRSSSRGYGDSPNLPRARSRLSALAESQILEQKASFQAFADKQAGGLFDKTGNKITQATLSPKVILVIGNKAELDQARSDLEREIKSRTFELHRRDSSSIDILTFDELYDRARHIVEIGDSRLG